MNGDNAKIEVQKQVWNELELLDISVSKLLDNTKELESALSGIISPPPPREAKNNEDENSLVNVAERIRDNRRRVESAYDFTIELLTRLEI